MLKIDYENSELTVIEEGREKTYPFESAEAFSHISRAWLRIGWDCKYVYSFSWMGRPIIQLPEDMFRLQEVIYKLQPTVIIETGVAHGGSLVFYASLLKAMHGGKVVGIDIEIRPHNREAIEQHPLSEYITLVEGSSTEDAVYQQVAAEVNDSDTVLVILDSNHSKAHVKRELELYSQLVSTGSYIVATDGIMGDLAGAPRSAPDWRMNNPRQAALEFVAENDEFLIREPEWPFNEGIVSDRVTYWPDCWIMRKP
jgi:cephalosporin hydroxylase